MTDVQSCSFWLILSPYLLTQSFRCWLQRWERQPVRFQLFGWMSAGSASQMLYIIFSQRRFWAAVYHARLDYKERKSMWMRLLKKKERRRRKNDSTWSTREKRLFPVNFRVSDATLQYLQDAAVMTWSEIDKCVWIRMIDTEILSQEDVKKDNLKIDFSLACFLAVRLFFTKRKRFAL